jgi:hypothetical protein
MGLARMNVTMTDLDRLKCIQGFVDGIERSERVAERLRITTRQVRRLAKRYRDQGSVGLLSLRRSQRSNNRLNSGLEGRVAGILRESYADFGPTLAAEKLEALHQIRLSEDTIRRIQMDAGLWIPRKLRPPKIQQPRTRRACTGELVQIDGCEHRWFENRGPVCTALVYVDDATSRLMTMYFCGAESTFGYFEATRQYIDRYGKPLAFYSDKASVFRVNKKDAMGGDGHTQFGRALYELNIDGICANSAAAKGRVERAHKTLQDRLVKELRLEGISSVETANAFMPAFMEHYNSKFAKAPRGNHDAHRDVRDDEDLELIFAWRELRKVTQNLTLHYDRKLYLLADCPEHRRLIGKYIDIFQYPDGRIEIRSGRTSIPYSTYDKFSVIKQGAIVENKRLGHALQVAQITQANRDSRSVSGPSTAHRPTGIHVPRTPVRGTKTQRQLSTADLEAAIQSNGSIAQTRRRLREAGLPPA